MPAEPQPVESQAQPSTRIRIWPVVLILVVMGALKVAPYLQAELSRGLFMTSVFAPMICGVALLLYWMLASGARSPERWIGPVVVAAIAVGSYALLDPTIQGMGYSFFVLPTGAAAIGLGLVALSRTTPKTRVIGMALATILGFGGWALMRNDGVWGDFQTSLHWRWEPTAEERYLASLKQSDGKAKPEIDESATVEITNAEWPQFRGPNQDGIVPGVVIDADWKAHPPKEIWRRPVGPGWSSFAVAGPRIFTQEQRGESEVIACYDANTGAERWIHGSPARFWESVAGAGPRATPALVGGRLFAMGATGLVHCLDAASGKELWQRDLVKDADRKPPTWGFSSSPLVLGDLVLIYAGGEGDKGLLAYEVATGEPRWGAPAGPHSYSSPQRATIDGHDVVLMLTDAGLSAVDPATGKTAWNYEWKFDGYRAIQPLVVDQSGVLLGTGMGTGTRYVNVALAGGSPTIEDRWTSLEIKPDFNDYVAYDGHLYGFDHNIFVCIDLATGKRDWKKGRYGNGQVLLLPDAGQLLVTSETGDVVLLHADAKKLDELARTKVLKDKTWNHPALAGNRLYLRNAEEAVCLELPLAGAASDSAKDVAAGATTEPPGQ